MSTSRIIIRLEIEGGGYHECVQEPCARPDCQYRGEHDKLWTIRRRVTAWGHFGTAMINGSRDVIDSSLPHVVGRIPRDAKPVDPVTAAGYWHDDNESHVFGGPNVAKALREAIAQANAR